MNERSATRRQLEASIRSLLPGELNLSSAVKSEPPTVAAVGLGGLMTGYVWGWFRGRRSRSGRKS
jgi:hypothetical protein